MSLRWCLIITGTAIALGCSPGSATPPADAGPSPQPSPPTEAPMLDMHGKVIQKQPPDVRLACQIEQAESSLRVRFEVSNAAAEPIHVYDGRAAGPRPFLYDGGGGAAHVLIGIPPLPDFPVAWRWTPKTTTLATGASLRREFTLNIPLREVDTYHPDKYDKYVPVTVERMALRVDFIRASKVSPQVKNTETAEAVFGEGESISCEVQLHRPALMHRRGDLAHRI